jgi:hypothetical protein
MQRPIVPTAAAAETVSPIIEHHPGNNDHQVFAVRVRKPNVTGRLRCTDWPRYQICFRQYPHKKSLIVAADFRTKDFLLAR